MTHQTCRLCVTQQTCLLCDTADMSDLWHSKTCLLCDTADMSAVWHSRHVCYCATQQTHLPCHTRHAPPACDTKQLFSVDSGEEQAPQCPRRNCPLRHIQHLYYAIVRFCVVGQEGPAPPCLRRKTTVLRRSQGRGKGSGPKSWISTPTPTQKLSFWGICIL